LCEYVCIYTGKKFIAHAVHVNFIKVDFETEQEAVDRKKGGLKAVWVIARIAIIVPVPEGVPARS
jgi:hypothetical protein